MTGEADHDGLIESFSQEPEHHLDLFWVGFEVVEGGTFADGEGFAAGLAGQFADGLGLIDPAIANESVDVVIGDTEVVTTRLRTGEAAGINRFLASAGTLTFRPGHDDVGIGEGGQADTSLAAGAIAGRFGFPGAG